MSTGPGAPAAERLETEAPSTGATGTDVAAGLPTSRLRPRAVVLAICFMVACALAGLAVGPTPIPIAGIVDSILGHLPLLGVHSHLTSTQTSILWEIRAPEVVLGLLVGGMLALSGSAYQGVFRNPLADPYLLGVSAGAGLGATIVIVYGSVNAGSDPYVLPAVAFAGALIAVALTYLMARGGRGFGTASLLLAGVAIDALLGAIQSYVQQQAPGTINQAYYWLLGSLAGAEWHDVWLILPYCAVGTVVVLAHRRTLDVLSLGDLEAASLGVDVGRVRLTVIAGASLVAAAVVSVSGLIGFVGLIIPHAVRMAAGSSYRIVSPLSMFVGAGFLVLCDVVAGRVLAPQELPIGVVTAVIGAPFFILVLRTRRAGGIS